MIDTQTPLQQTPLYQEHLQLKAKLVPFAGWLMPLQYEGILNEYQHTRTSVSIFDTSHMGEFIVEGNALDCGLNQIVTQKIVDMPVRSCRYGAMLNEAGGILDDLIVYRIAKDKWLIVVNAAHIDSKADYIKGSLKTGARFCNISSQTGKLDIQGPLAREVLLKFIPDIGKLEYFFFDEFHLLEEKIIISRTGYTGELGYEIYFPGDKISLLWKKLLENKEVKPAGLGARDVLRLEMGYSLYGNDLDTTISPVEAGLGSFVDLEKEFIGKTALIERKTQGILRKMIFFMAEGRQAPRHHHKIFSDDLKEIGVVTSGTFSPAVKRGIGMGLVDRQQDLKGKDFFVGDDKLKIKVALAQRPFYKEGSLRN